MPDDIVTLIKAQHREVERLLDQAEEEGADTLALLRQVSELLIPHSQAEESFVYPAIKRYDASEADEVKDGAAEHHHIEAVLTELLAEDPDSPGYDGKQAGMVGELRHHIEEEEQDLLPVLSEKASAGERAEMAARFATATNWTGGGAGDGDATRDELYERAKEQGVPGRSEMTKDELRDAAGEA